MQALHSILYNLKGGFTKKKSRNVELCLLILVIIFILPTMFIHLLAAVPGFNFLCSILCDVLVCACRWPCFKVRCLVEVEVAVDHLDVVGVEVHIVLR